MRGDLWEIYKGHPRTVFDVFTNGTLIGKLEAERIAKLGNVRLLISLEGLKKTTDNRRGDGVYDRAAAALTACQQANIHFAVSVTVSQENFEEVTSEEFIEAMNEFGIHIISYVLYMPYGTNNGMFSAPTKEQVKQLEKWGEWIQDHYPIVPVIGRNGSDLVTACPAALGRLHITADGRVEPCPFCHFAADSITGKTILEVMDSELFQLIRTVNSTGAFPTPCKARESPVLQRLFEKAGAYSTTKGE